MVFSLQEAEISPICVAKCEPSISEVKKVSAATLTGKSL